MSINVTGIFLPTTTITVRPQLSTPTKERKIRPKTWHGWEQFRSWSLSNQGQPVTALNFCNISVFHLNNRGNTLRGTVLTIPVAILIQKNPSSSHLINLRTYILCCLCTPYLPKSQVLKTNMVFIKEILKTKPANKQKIPTGTEYKPPTLHLQFYHGSKLLPRSQALKSNAQIPRAHLMDLLQPTEPCLRQTKGYWNCSYWVEGITQPGYLHQDQAPRFSGGQRISQSAEQTFAAAQLYFQELDYLLVSSCHSAKQQ